MSTKSKIAKEVKEVAEVETTRNGRPVRSSAKPVSYKEESVNKRGQASSEPAANRKKKVNSNSYESAVPPKKAAAGKKKPEPENGNTENDEAPAKENGSKTASRKRKIDVDSVDDKLSAEKVNGAKAAKPRQKKIEKDVAEDDDDAEPKEEPELEAEKGTKPLSRKKVKEPIDNSSNGNRNPGTSKPVAPKAAKGKKTPVTENEADNEDENGDDENQATSKAAATKGNKGKKKVKEPVVATAPEAIDDENDGEENVPSKAAALKTAKGKKTAKGSSNVETEDAEEKVDDKKKASRQPKKPKETSTKATVSKSTKAKDDEEVSNVAGKRTAVKRKLGPVQDETDGPIVFKRSASTTQEASSRGEAAAAKVKLNSVTTDYSQVNYSLPTKEWNFKISSWNVAGLRALIEKGGMKFVEKEDPDIFCVQETKCLEEEVPEHLTEQKYHKYWLGKKGGKGGVGLYSKVMPYDVKHGIDNEEMDSEARVLTAEFTKFIVVCVYVPNAGRGLVNLSKRLKWDKLFQDYLVKLNQKKPVIIVGDMNVSHLDIDLANPKGNKRNAGFTKEERDGMTRMLSLGFVDTFRALYPDRPQQYTFWTYMQNARSKNIGWRLDYFIVSESLKSKVVDNIIRSEVMGSDHCPMTLFLNI